MGWDGIGVREEPPHRSRKDRRRWCRGKPEAEHQPKIELDKHWASRQRYGPDPVVCRWSMWVIEGRPVDDKLRYSCYHQEVCGKCGKVLRWRLLPAECPEHRPAPIAFEELLCKRCGCLLGEHVRGDCACRIHTTCTRFFWEDV